MNDKDANEHATRVVQTRKLVDAIDKAHETLCDVRHCGTTTAQARTIGDICQTLVLLARGVETTVWSPQHDPQSALPVPTQHSGGTTRVQSH